MKINKLLKGIFFSLILGAMAFNNPLWAQSPMAPACDISTSTSGVTTGGSFPLQPTIQNVNGAIDGSLNDDDAAIFNALFSAGSPFWQFDVNLNGTFTGDVYINSRVAASIFGATFYRILPLLLLTAIHRCGR